MAAILSLTGDGRGKGNRFLNDLCDADVLVHIIDGSGKSDEQGVRDEQGGHDIVNDVQWIHAELQRWILDNLRAKWQTVQRKPEHLYDMLTGYQAQRWLTHEALRIAGVLDGGDLATSLPTWSDETLSKVVDHFLAVRFPTVLAANKCDDEAAAANVAKLQEVLGSQGELGDGAVRAVVPLSARLECELQRLAASGVIGYTPATAHAETGTSTVVRSGSADLAGGGLAALKATERATLASAAAFGLLADDEPLLAAVCGDAAAPPEPAGVHCCVGSTGVREVLDCAMSLRPPVLVWPVLDVQSGASYPLNPEEPRSDVTTLRDVLVLKPGTTVMQLFEILLHPPWSLLGGEYVRAEARPRAGGATRQLRKEDVLDDACCVVRIRASRKGLRVKVAGTGGGADAAAQ